MGLVAEEVGQVVPDIVQWEEDGRTAAGLKYTHLTALTVEAIKELRVEKDAQIADLKKRVERLEALLEAASASHVLDSDKPDLSRGAK
jgi:hypothetical protein